MKQVDTIKLWTAEGNKGISVNLDKYALVRDFIIGHLTIKVESTLSELLEDGKAKLSDKLHDDELSFLVVKVKGDLEARAIIRKQWKLGRIQIISLKSAIRKNISRTRPQKTN